MGLRKSAANNLNRQRNTDANKNPPNNRNQFSAASAFLRDSGMGKSILDNGCAESQLSKNLRIRASPVKSKPAQESSTLGVMQLITSKVPSIDVNTIRGSIVHKLDDLLQISRSVELMAPPTSQIPMALWMVTQLKHFNFFNSRLVH